ncbi:hypothetical protein ACFL2Q_04375 [Thermodesulfobacteriota bacterium]
MGKAVDIAGEMGRISCFADEFSQVRKCVIWKEGSLESPTFLKSSDSVTFLTVEKQRILLMGSGKTKPFY